MKVLIACEFSGTVRDAFIAAGHDAMSCDLLPTEKPGPHYQGDVTDILNDGWDLMVAHPPCTYLSSSGMHWNKNPKSERFGGAQTEEALDFVRLLLDAPIHRIALENPIGHISSRIREPDQIIQPWQFEEDASKATCFWLKNLPPLSLDRSLFVPPRLAIHNDKWVMRWANQTDSGQNRLPPSEDRWAIRSLTYPGIAKAIADQWGSTTKQLEMAA